MNDKPKLTPLQQQVLYEDKTEPPFQNAYWDTSEHGLYVHPVTLEAMFSSYDKFVAHCGWPTFYRPLHEGVLTYLSDHSHGMTRTEIREPKSNTHLGHVFSDLDQNLINQGYQRFCLNSAALKFVSEKEILAAHNAEWTKWYEAAKKLNAPHIGVITIGGGCFWGVQHLMRHINGIYHTVVGYANFNDHYQTVNYEQVCHENTGAVEVVQITYHKQHLPLQKLLKIVFDHVDPTTLNKQGNDRGTQYRSGVYYHDSADQALIDDFLAHHLAPLYDQPIVVEVLPLKKFVAAENYHQNYLVKNPNGYCHIKF